MEMVHVLILSLVCGATTGTERGSRAASQQAAEPGLLRVCAVVSRVDELDFGLDSFGASVEGTATC